MSYKFLFQSDSEFYLPFKYQTVNEDGTRTPIDLTGKRIVIEFTPRAAAEPILTLDSDEGATANGSAIVIVDAVGGEFEITITEAEIEAMIPATFGRAEMRLYQTVGGTILLMDVPFARK